MDLAVFGIWSSAKLQEHYSASPCLKKQRPEGFHYLPGPGDKLRLIHKAAAKMEIRDPNPGVQFCVRRPDRLLFTPVHRIGLGLGAANAISKPVGPDGSEGPRRPVPVKLRGVYLMHLEGRDVQQHQGEISHVAFAGNAHSERSSGMGLAGAAVKFLVHKD